jgi:hypothetical protein
MCEVAPAPLMSESFLSRDRLSFVFFTGSRKRKRQVSVISSSQQGDTSGQLPPGQYQERGFPVLSAGPTPHTSLTSWEFSIVGEIDQPKRWARDEFRALCKRLPGGDHEPAIATLIAVGDAVSFRLVASPTASLVGQGSRLLH